MGVDKVGGRSDGGMACWVSRDAFLSGRGRGRLVGLGGACTCTGVDRLGDGMLMSSI